MYSSTVSPVPHTMFRSTTEWSLKITMEPKAPMAWWHGCNCSRHSVVAQRSTFSVFR